MGQRHQLFVIAKVKGRYRTLCAIHHQWLYGHTALRRCLGTLKKFQAPMNRLPIKQELIAAQRHDKGFWEYSNNAEYLQKNSHVPFPFIATCLVLGASYDPSGYFHQTSIEPFYMPYDGGDNNEGITIFDITNPSHVSYCFVSFQGLEGRHDAPLMTPLSARRYLDAYYDLADPENKNLLPLVESFKDRGLIPASVLEDAWPDEGWNEAETDVQEGEGEELDLQLTKLEISPKPTQGTLRGLTMDAVLQDLLDSPQANSSLMDEAELLTDFLPKLKDKMYDQAPTMKWSPYHLDLLCQALQNEAVVDLTPLTNVAAKDLAVIVEKLSGNGNMKVLNLSNRPDISLEDLRHIIDTVTDLRVLCLLEMPQIPLQSLYEYLVDFEIHHSDLLRSALRESDPDYNDYQSHVKELHTKLRAAGVVSQLVWIGLGRTDTKERRNYLPNGRIAWEDMTFSSETDRAIGGKTALQKRTYDLSVPLPPYKLIPGVLRLLQWAGSCNLNEFCEPCRGMACSLASLLPHSNDTGHGVSFLNPSLYLLRDSYRSYEVEEQTPFCLKPGEWALFLISEAFDVEYELFVRLMTKFDNYEKDQDSKFNPRKATSYALVTRVPGSEPPQYLVADIPTFLKYVLGNTPEAQELLDAWTGGFPSIRDAEFFGDDTYKILRKLSPEDSTLESKEAQDSKEVTEPAGKGGIRSGSTDTGDHGTEVH